MSASRIETILTRGVNSVAMGRGRILAVGIEEEMLADLVVLDKDPARINELEVEMTFLAGKIVYQREGISCG
ncbi:MAG: hypothetical protein U9N00_03075 [Candidatus Bipolaricaulota bacterium]|nr:hypothetical protein [Candidatus Bipolaricaulota bacterium]